MLRFHTLDVFTQTPYAGNPLAVVLGGDALSTQQMQAIAREFNFTESVFVLPSEHPEAMLRLRIFTPLEELQFAGHPSIGAACLLAEKGLVPPGDDVCFAFEEAVGIVQVRIAQSAGAPVRAQIWAAQKPELGSTAPDSNALAAALGLEAEAIGLGQEGPMVASCGLPMLLVPLSAPEQLAGISVDYRALAPLAKSCAAHSVYVYARGYEGELRTRLFSPGIGEDPATGSAAMALAARLAMLPEQADGDLRWEIRQGVEMRRPSEIHVTVEKKSGQIEAVTLAGHALQIMEGHLHYP